MEAAEAGAEGTGSDGWRAFAIFCAAALAFAAAYLGTVLLGADLGVFLDPSGRFGLARIVRFNAALGLVLAYLCASLWLGQRWVRHDFEALRGVVDAGDAEWVLWAQRVRAPRIASRVRAALFGAATGLLVDFIGARASVPAQVWRGHVVWVWVLNPALFAGLGMLVRESTGSAALYGELGRRARVELGDVARLAPFARAGLRIALLWFLGTSLASVLLVDTDSPMLVVSILVVTTGIAVATLLAPSRGVHERLREAKRQELGWLRAEIARASSALRRGDERGAAQLPALVAWETRVADAPEWPFDTSTFVRFLLFLLVPIGSWLGGALVDRLVERWLGA